MWLTKLTNTHHRLGKGEKKTIEHKSKIKKWFLDNKISLRRNVLFSENGIKYEPNLWKKSNLYCGWSKIHNVTFFGKKEENLINKTMQENLSRLENKKEKSEWKKPHNKINGVNKRIAFRQKPVVIVTMHFALSLFVYIAQFGLPFFIFHFIAFHVRVFCFHSVSACSETHSLPFHCSLLFAVICYWRTMCVQWARRTEGYE